MKNAKIRKNLITGTWKAKLFYVCVLALPILQYIIFGFGAQLNSLLLSFKGYDMQVGDYVFSMEAMKYNYRQFFFELSSSSSNLGKWFLNSFYAWFFTAVIGSALALFFAYYIAKKAKGSSFFRLMLFMPSIIPPIALGLIFRRYTDKFLFDFFGLFDWDFGKPFSGLPKQNFTAAIWYNLLFGFGVNVLMFSGAMSRVPESLTEYASLDGIKPLQEFIYIMMPLIFPTFSTFFVMGIGGYFTNQLNLYSFYGARADQSIWTLGYFMHVKVVGDGGGGALADFPYISAYGMIFTLVAVPVTLFVKWVMDKITPDVEY